MVDTTQPTAITLAVETYGGNGVALGMFFLNKYLVLNKLKKHSDIYPSIKYLLMCTHCT
jgi:hypothetical protein